MGAQDWDRFFINLLGNDPPDDTPRERLLSLFYGSATRPRLLKDLPESQTMGMSVWVEGRSLGIGNGVLSTPLTDLRFWS